MQHSAQALKRIVEHLQREQVVTLVQAQAALAHHQRTGARIEEVVLELALMEEGALLRSLATLYRTRFASTERLAAFSPDPKLIELVPRKYAEQYLVCPMTFDGGSGVLTVVTPDADDVAMLQGLRVATSAREVRALVVRPAAAKAMLARLYAGDAHAFALLERESVSRAAESSYGSFLGESVRPPGERYTSIPPPTEPIQTPRSRMSDRAPAVFGSAPTLGAIGTITSMPTSTAMVGARGLDGFRDVLARVIAFFDGRDPQSNPDHAQHVARVARVLAERVTAPLGTTQAVEVAAMLHDVGKGSVGHLSTFNVAQYPDYAAAAKKVYANPIRLFEGSKIPVEVSAALQHMYERFDGRGFPLGQRGREIPLGARVLAVADAYADLTENPGNPYRRRLSPEECASVIATLRDAVYDPAIVDTLTQAVQVASARAQLTPAWTDVLIVDPSVDDAYLLRAAALEAGFRPRIVASVELARVALTEGRYDVVLVDVEDGPWSFLGDLQSGILGARVPFAAVGRTLERSIVERLGSLGPLDIAPKSLAPGALFERLRQALDGVRSRGGSALRGRLQDIELPDVLQTLIQARKSGRLVIRAARGVGEIHFNFGSIVDGFFGERQGEDAVVALVRLRDGEFDFDAAFKPGLARIQTPTEMLLLEAMRRIDESSLRPM